MALPNVATTRLSNAQKRRICDAVVALTAVLIVALLAWSAHNPTRVIHEYWQNTPPAADTAPGWSV